MTIIDLHAHPSMKTYFGWARLARRQTAGPGFNPLGLRTSYGSLVAGGVDLLGSAVYVPEQQLKGDCIVFPLIGLFSSHLRKALQRPPDEVAVEMLRHVEQQVSQVNAGNPPPARPMTVVRSLAELRAALAAGHLAVVHTIEGAHVLDRKIENVRRFRELGVAILTLAHFYDYGVAPPVDGIPNDFFLRKLGCFRWSKDLSLGLPLFGAEVVEAMFEQGIVVDLTHATPRARGDVLALPNPRRRPIVMSHVGVQALMDHPINPTDDEIRRLAGTGGVIGVIFYSHWLVSKHPRKPDVLANVVATVDHLVRVGGEESVAFGSDFDGMTDPPDDLKEPARWPALLAALDQAGYSPTSIERFTGGNALRVLEAGWS